jgi:hypothetical protein
MKKFTIFICFFTFITGILINLFIFFLAFHFRFFAGPIFEFYLNFIDNFVPKQGINVDYIVTNIENLNLFEEALGISFFGLTLCFSCIFFFLAFLRNLFHINFYFLIFMYIFFFFLGFFLFGFKHFIFFYEETPSQCLVTDMNLTLNLVIDLSKYFVIILFFFTPLFFIPFFFFLRYFIFFLYFYTEKEIFIFYNNEPPLSNLIDNYINIKYNNFFFLNTNSQLELFFEKILTTIFFFFEKSLFYQLILTLFLFNYIFCFFFLFFKYTILRKKWDLNPR